MGKREVDMWECDVCGIEAACVRGDMPKGWGRASAEPYVGVRVARTCEALCSACLRDIMRAMERRPKVAEAAP